MEQILITSRQALTSIKIAGTVQEIKPNMERKRNTPKLRKETKN